MVVVCMERKLCLVLTSRTYQESLLLFDLTAVVIQGSCRRIFTGVRDQYYQQTTLFPPFSFSIYQERYFEIYSSFLESQIYSSET